MTSTVERTHRRALSWFSDGWHGYRSILMQAYRECMLTGKRGRPPWVVPETIILTQTAKHRNEHGRLNGALRDLLNALTRKTHAFAKRDATRDALVGLQLFDHNFHQAHQALWLPFEHSMRRYRQRPPAMALGLADHLWSFQALLTSRIPITP